MQVIVRVRPEPGATAAPIVVAQDDRSVALLPLPFPPPDPTGKAKPAVDTKVAFMKSSCCVRGLSGVFDDHLARGGVT